MARKRINRVNKPRPLPEADASAESVRSILEAKHGEQDWILQVAESVRGAVDLGIKQLGSSSVSGNSMPISHGAQYSFPPRMTQEEFDAAPAANAHHVDPKLKEEELQKPSEVTDGDDANIAERDGPVSWVY